jgi:hypothetical protein
MKITFASICLVLVGCGGSGNVANVAGDYSINVTNGANGCNYPNWMQGTMASNIAFTITQNGASVTGVLGGAVAIYFDGLLGGHTFTGGVEGSTVQMTLYGKTVAQSGNCTYTVNATVTGTSNGNFLAGTIDYTDQGNGNPDCAAIQGCKSTQSFTGSRPPL